jgi:predicted nucleic acid-binding protein
LVSQVVLLDAGVIGLLTNPNRTPNNVACARWLQAIAMARIRVIVPEIADYEVRRELLRAKKVNGLRRLDELIAGIEYLPITTPAMRQAALFWAQARQQGQPTAGDTTIDADMILVAQALVLNVADAVIATTNVGHLSRFFHADLWGNIRP